MALRLPTIPPLTRGLLFGLLILTLLNAGARYRKWAPNPAERIDSRTYYVPYLTIIPGQSIIYPWVFLTATLAEQNALGLIITGASLFYGGRYLERAWSSREYAKFILIISLVPNLITFFLYFGLFVVTRNAGLVTTAISGGIAIQASFLVSFKQLVPEHTITLFRSLISMRVKHFPSVFLLANTISGLLLGTDTAMLLAWAGFLTSWIYLRFYRVSPSLFSTSTGLSLEQGADIGAGSATGQVIKGDASDTFAFAAFWPDIVQPPISVLCDQVYALCVNLRIITPFSAEDVDAGNEQATVREGGSELPSLLHQGGRGGGGGAARGEAERRRQLALRALDQRLMVQQTRGRGAEGKTQEVRPPVRESSPVHQTTGDQAQVGPVEDGAGQA